MESDTRTANAILKVLDMGRNSEYKLQKFLMKKKKASIYDIANEMGWTYGKTQGVVQRLSKKALVGFEYDLKNNRSRKLVFLTPSEILLKPKAELQPVIVR